MGNFEYDIPLASWSPLANFPSRLTRGWMILGIYSAKTGLPLTVVSPYGSLQYGYDIFDGFSARPFLLQKPTLAPHVGSGPQFLSDAVLNNPGAFFGTPTVL